MTAARRNQHYCPQPRLMLDTAAGLVDCVLPCQPVRQWLLLLPFALRYLFVTRPEVITPVLGIVCRAISGHVIGKAGSPFENKNEPQK